MSDQDDARGSDRGGSDHSIDPDVDDVVAGASDLVDMLPPEAREDGGKGPLKWGVAVALLVLIVVLALMIRACDDDESAPPGAASGEEAADDREPDAETGSPAAVPGTVTIDEPRACATGEPVDNDAIAVRDISLSKATTGETRISVGTIGSASELFASPSGAATAKVATSPADRPSSAEAPAALQQVAKDDQQWFREIHNGTETEARVVDGAPVDDPGLVTGVTDEGFFLELVDLLLEPGDQLQILLFNTTDPAIATANGGPTDCTMATFDFSG